METFIKISMTLAAIGAIARFIMMAAASYPRTVTYTRGEHAMGVLIGLAWVVYGWSVLP
jgi:hypothetical protein